MRKILIILTLLQIGTCAQAETRIVALKCATEGSTTSYSTITGEEKGGTYQIEEEFNLLLNFETQQVMRWLNDDIESFHTLPYSFFEPDFIEWPFKFDEPGEDLPVKNKDLPEKNFVVLNRETLEITHEYLWSVTQYKDGTKTPDWWYMESSFAEGKCKVIDIPIEGLIKPKKI